MSLSQEKGGCVPSRSENALMQVMRNVVLIVEGFFAVLGVVFEN